ncbi:MAG TPA: phosphatidate cytidylyltransferase [Terriglobia bacterium]|nr:phosphatidate cytidylyltransferase [Terriglobia bacterium]
MKRVLTALVLVPVLIAIIGYAPPPCFLLLVAGATVLALEEFFLLAAHSGLEIFRIPGHGSSLLLLASFYGFPASSWLALLTLVVSGLLFFALGLRRGERLQTVLPGVAATMLGLLYVSLTLGLLVVLQRSSTSWGPGRGWIFFLLLVVWFGDTGAYYTGRALGRHSLAPLISPKKTIEGAVGGLLGNVLAAFLGKQIFLREAPLIQLLLLSVLLGTVGQIGDLSESALKRGAGVKDSSNLLPGHGGMLDRIDGVLFASPVMFGYVHFVLGRY